MSKELSRCHLNLIVTITNIVARNSVRSDEERQRRITAAGDCIVPGALYHPALTSTDLHLAYLVLKADAEYAQVCPVFDRPVLEYEHPDIWEFNEPALVPFTWHGWGEPIAHLNARDDFPISQVKTWRLLDVLPSWKIKRIRRAIWRVPQSFIDKYLSPEQDENGSEGRC